MLVSVNDDGVAAENFVTSFYNASAAATFIEDVINYDEGPDSTPPGTSTLTSDFIKGNIVSGQGTNLDVTALLQTCSIIPALGYDPVGALPTVSGSIAGNAELPVSSAAYPGTTATGGYHYFSGTPVTTTGLDPKYGMFGNKISTTYTSTGTGGWQDIGVGGHTVLDIFGFNVFADKFTPPHLKLVQGTYKLAGGDSGTGSDETTRATAIIGKVDASSTKRTGMQAFADEGLGITLALVPGIQTQSVQNNLITLAETSQNFLALLSCPEAIGGAQSAIQYVNGLGNGRTSPMNSSYAAVYFPHVKVFSTYDGKDRFYDPAIYAARQMAFTDKSSETWFAPAGLTRGRITKASDVEVPLSQGDRDALYSGGNVVNPIVKFPKDGIMIFGQRTTQRAATALDRVNVRRLMIEIRKLLLAGGRAYVFEPNDEFTYVALQAQLNEALDSIKRRRGIQEFKVICDETTNTAARVDRNELWCKILVKPTKTAEIIVFEVNLTNQSAKIQN
jgi:phage tail sheath protein FI